MAQRKIHKGMSWTTETPMADVCAYTIYYVRNTLSVLECDM